jgi:hypothetical protein
VDAQAVVWFVIALIAGFTGVRILVDRFILRKPQALESRGGHTLFAVCMLVFALGAVAAGLVSVL